MRKLDESVRRMKEAEGASEADKLAKSDLEKDCNQLCSQTAELSQENEELLERCEEMAETVIRMQEQAEDDKYVYITYLHYITYHNWILDSL